MTREQWLEQAVELMRPLFKEQGYTIPPLRVTCGWPSARGLSAKNRTLGQCWDKSAATDERPQIFISPYLVHPLHNNVASKDGFGVLPVLVHEVVHAVVGIKAGHGAIFGKCARAVGLEGKLTSTNAGASLTEYCENWSNKLGEYPHAKLDSLKSPVKKQSTRMIKMECSECGYVARTSKKWLDEAGPCHCPKHGAMKYENPEEKDEDDE